MLPIDDRGLDVRPALREEQLYVSAEPARLTEPMTIERLAEAPLILYDARWGADDPTRRQLRERAQRAGVKLEPQIEVEYVTAALDLCARGLGDTISTGTMLRTRGYGRKLGERAVRSAALRHVRVHHPPERPALAGRARVHGAGRERVAALEHARPRRARAKVRAATRGWNERYACIPPRRSGSRRAGAAPCVGEPRGDAARRRRRQRAHDPQPAIPFRPSSRDERPGRRPRGGRAPPRAAPRRSRPRSAARSPPRYQSGIESFSWSCRWVAISPGKTVVTDTPVPLSSCRSASANARWAALVAP